MAVVGAELEVVAGKVLGAVKAQAACRVHWLLCRLTENGRKKVDTGVLLAEGEQGEQRRCKDKESVPSHRLWGRVMWQAEA